MQRSGLLQGRATRPVGVAAVLEGSRCGSHAIAIILRSSCSVTTAAHDQTHSPRSLRSHGGVVTLYRFSTCHVRVKW